VDYQPSRDHPDILPYAVDLFRKVDAMTKDTYDQLASQSKPIRRVILGREAPWELIDGPPEHRRVVKLWWSGMKQADIAADDQVCYSGEDYVRTLLGRLRQKYGKDIVPDIDDLRERGIR
jgi:hypothetical protein